MKAPYEMFVRAWEANLIPDFIIRKFYRRLLSRRLDHYYKPNAALQQADLMAFVNSLKQMPVSLDMAGEEAKEALYEVPPAFLKLVLGKQFKFSCLYYIKNTSTIDEAEEAMLALYCERAKLEDGQTVLELGCGWGCLTLYIAKRYPNSQVTAITNSTGQKGYIEDQCREKGISNVVIFAGDVTKFELEGTFDRILSIEMVEYMRNYGILFKKISLWMKPDTLLFIEHLCHKAFSFHFEDCFEDDLVARHHLPGVTILASNLLLYFQDDVAVVDHWLENGKHQAQSCDAWLKKLDKNLTSIVSIFNDVYGESLGKKTLVYWRTLFLAFSEMFGYNAGDEWMITHILFQKK